MKQIIEKKETLSKELAEDLKKAKAIILFEYLGLNAKTLTALRKKLHTANAKMYVQKNNIFRRALALANVEGFGEISGPNALLVAFGDEIAPFKEINEVIKIHNFVKYKNGRLVNDMVSASKLASIANIPGREGLLSMLLSCLQTSIRNLAYGIKAVGEHK
jgi:large subunit ribosomal protein L10